MKRFFSSFISAVLIFNLFQSLCFADKSFGVEDIVDFDAVQINDNMIDSKAREGFTYLCINNNASWDYTLNPNSSVNWYVKDGYSQFEVIDGGWNGFQGFELSKRNAPFSINPQNNKSYVVSLNIRNDSENGIVPYFGMAVNNSWDANDVIYSDTYGKEGMPLDKSGWINFKDTIKLSDNYIDAVGNGEYKDYLYFGMNKNMPKGTAYSIDVSDSDSVYIAEEKVNDIKIHTDSSTVLIGKKSIDLSAEIVNQIGTKGNLNQEFEWYAVDVEENTFTSDITFVPKGSSSNVSAVCGDGVTGEYLIAAKSKNYEGVIRTIKIIVTEESLHDSYASVPENIIIDSSAEGGLKYLQRNSASITHTPTDSDGVSSVRLLYDGSADYDMGETYYRYFEGAEYNSNEKNLNFTAVPGKTYVFSARVKNDCQNENVRFGCAMNGGWGTSTAVLSNENPNGIIIGRDWTDFKSTISLPADYNNSTIYFNTLYFGFPDGTKGKTAVLLDVSTKDSVYFAEEVPCKVSLTCENKDDIKKGSEVIVKGSVLNQIGIKGTLNQNIRYLALNGKRDRVVSGVSLSETDDGVKVTVNDTQDLDDGLVIVGISGKYNLIGGVSLIGNYSNLIQIYVSPDGNDQNNGLIEHPLKTLSAAKQKIRNYKRLIDSPTKYEIIFRGGTYRFDNPEYFLAEDSGDEQNHIVYKAFESEKVIFSGAKCMDASAAKTITDESVLSRIDDNLKGKIKEFDLTEQLGQWNNSSIYPTSQQLNGEYEFPMLFLNDVEQTLSEWPNGEGNYSKFTRNGDDKLSDNNIPHDWSNAALSNCWVGGYFAWDYQYFRMPIKSVNGKQLSVETDLNHSLKIFDGRDDITHRWKAYNLLEEIDTVSEWCIENDKLYYYTSENYENMDLEIATLTQPIITLNSTKYVDFENIEFTKTRGDGIVLKNVYDVNVNNCVFSNIGVDAYKITGSQQAECDKDYWQRQTINAAYNCDVSSCKFYNIGGHAAMVDGGNVDTLKKGNNVIENCIFSRISQKVRNYDAILLLGCGNSLLHCNISRTPFQAIRFYGNDHSIMYNEIYNVRQESDDSGAIYCGRNAIQCGTEIKYNYLHDLCSTDKMVNEYGFKHLPAIYWDDNQACVSAENNIIVNAETNVYTNGVGSRFIGNTSVNIKKANLDFRNGGVASNSDLVPEPDVFAGNIADENLYFARYQNLQYIIDYARRVSRKSRGLAQYTSVKNNLCVYGTGTNSIQNYTKYIKDPESFWFIELDEGELNPNVSGNVDNGDYGCFVNPDKQDFRVKNSSEYANLGVLNEDFDIEQIGVIGENDINLKDFEIPTYEFDSKSISGKIHLSWNDVPFTSKYRVVISKDEKMEQVIKTVDECYDNYADIEFDYVEGEKYYWQVYAFNTSREFYQYSQSNVSTFTIGEKITILSEIQQDNKIKLSVENNYYKDGIEADIFLVEYDVDGILIAAQYFKEDLSYKTPINFIGNNITVKNKNSRVKVFAWNNHVPLCDCKVIQ